MDICSDNEFENVVTQVEDEEIFSRVFNRVFNRESQLMEEDDLIAERNNNIYFIRNNNRYYQNEDEITASISIEEHNKTKDGFLLFKPWSKNYSYNKLYSKDIKFQTNYRQKEYEEEDITKKKKLGEESRKYDADNIRKVIKADFSSAIIDNLNEKIQVVNNGLKFSYFAQCEVVNGTKEENEKILNFTLKEMILNRPFDYLTQKNEKTKEKNELHWQNNKNILDYLESLKSAKIYQKLELEFILNMKMKDLYEEYLRSDEFQKSIEKLRNQGNYYDYIHKYFEVAKNVIHYYMPNKKGKEKKVNEFL